jgi:hypothetical protein
LNFSTRLSKIATFILLRFYDDAFSRRSAVIAEHDNDIPNFAISYCPRRFANVRGEKQDL